MKDQLFAHIEEILEPCSRPLPPPKPGDWRLEGSHPSQSFGTYRWSRPARQTARRKAIYLSQIGHLTSSQEQVISLTAEYLALFFDLPIHRGQDFDPVTFPSSVIREHPFFRHDQLLTHYLINEVLWLDRPEEALICLAVTAWDLWSDDIRAGDWTNVLGEAFGGHAGVWSLYHLGNPDRDPKEYQRCLKRSFATATHEAAHVLGLDHCAEALCNMNGSNCAGIGESQPLYFCPVCLRKLSWNRQFHLPSYLQKMSDFLGRCGFSEEADLYESMNQLLPKDKIPTQSNCSPSPRH